MSDAIIAALKRAACMLAILELVRGHYAVEI